MNTRNKVTYTSKEGNIREVYSMDNPPPMYNLLIKVNLTDNVRLIIPYTSNRRLLPDFFKSIDSFRYGLQGLRCTNATGNFLPCVAYDSKNMLSIIGVAYGMNGGVNALHFLGGDGTRYYINTSVMNYSAELLGDF